MRTPECSPWSEASSSTLASDVAELPELETPQSARRRQIRARLEALPPLAWQPVHVAFRRLRRKRGVAVAAAADMLSRPASVMRSSPDDGRHPRTPDQGLGSQLTGQCLTPPRCTPHGAEALPPRHSKRRTAAPPCVAEGDAPLKRRRAHAMPTPGGAGSGRGSDAVRGAEDVGELYSAVRHGLPVGPTHAGSSPDAVPAMASPCTLVASQAEPPHDTEDSSETSARLASLECAVRQHAEANTLELHRLRLMLCELLSVRGLGAGHPAADAMAQESLDGHDGADDLAMVPWTGHLQT